MSYIVKLDNITKTYDEVTALDKINLSIEKGKVHGLIGRNGAGKTTILKLISDMIRPTEGSIEYNREIITKSSDICFVRDYNHYFANYRIRDILYISSKIYSDWDYELEKNIIDLFELSTKKIYSKSSKGMQTMTSIIIALCSNAKMILMDEPYSGLDPINREVFYRLLRERCFDLEKTVIISSHLINEIEGYFEKAIMINKGKILIDDDVDSIYEKSFTIECDEKTATWLKGHKHILKEEKMAGQYVLYLYDELNQKEKEDIVSEGAQLKGMDLQKLLITYCSSLEVVR